MYRLYIKILLFSLLFLPALAQAEVSKIVFTTDPQTIKPGELSSVITIQAQDGSGNSTPTTETIDLEFQSTSATGEFLGSTGNPATKTMNKNTANRSFYYRDSATGTFTLTVNAKGRESGKGWTLSQGITVSNTATPPPEEEDEDEEEEEESGNTSGGNSSDSSHHSSVPLTKFTSGNSFKIGAGRERISTMGTPLEFAAEANVENLNGVRFEWNFGDGSTDSGSSVVHSYAYPGEYVVVLNAVYGTHKAVSRTSVSVHTPELSITYASGERIEVTNNSTKEINLYGRALYTQGKIFSFPQDTIVQAGQKISFASSVTGLVPQSTLDTTLVVIGTNPNLIELKETLVIEEDKRREIARLQTEIASLQSALASMEYEQVIVTNVVPSTPAVTEVTQVEVPEDNVNLVASVYLASTTPDTEPQNWWETIKEFFLWRR